MKYFHIAQGLRGMYMPDNSCVVACKTRRELRKCVDSEVSDTLDAGFYLNQKDVSCVAAAAWREAHKEHPTYLDFVVPYGRKRTGDRPFAVMVSVATRDEYRAYCAENRVG